MKDEIVCCVIALLLAGLFVLNGHVVRSNTQNIVKAIENAENNEESYEEIQHKWKAKKKALFYFCSHGIVTEIDENISMGCEYMKMGNAKKAEHLYKKAKLILEDLAQREKIKLDNIF